MNYSIEVGDKVESQAKTPKVILVDKIGDGNEKAYGRWPLPDVKPLSARQKRKARKERNRMWREQK